MFRTFLVVASVATATLITPAINADEPGKFKFGEPYKGDVGDTLVVSPYVGTAYSAYPAEIPVTLKAGQDLSITCTVVGKDRHVLLMLLDPKGKQIGVSTSGVKTTSLKVEEVSANGEYKIQVFTSLIGPYELWATATPDDELDERKLEEKLKRLKKEVELTEARLKAIREKKKKP